MKLNKRIGLLVFLFIAWSCKNDDEEVVINKVEQQSLAETVVTDDANIKAYLETHFYNYEEFNAPPADFDFKIRLDTIAGDNADKTPLINQVNTQNITVSSFDFFMEDEEVVEHTLYYLIVNEGVGESPTIGDDVVVRYQGSLLDNTIFDSSVSPVNFNLSGVVRGFGNAVEKFKVGEGPIENGDGTVRYEDYGIGAVFMPSGLGYFQDISNQTSLARYSPLVFTFDLLSYAKDTDSDADGIPSLLEDLNGDGNLNNDDTDEDGIPNYGDLDDDGDGVPTLEEISDENGMVLTPYPDTDKDTIPDHLDPDTF